jgi:hypothetical protein
VPAFWGSPCGLMRRVAASPEPLIGFRRSDCPGGHATSAASAAVASDAQTSKVRRLSWRSAPKDREAAYDRGSPIGISRQ